MAGDSDYSGRVLWVEPSDNIPGGKLGKGIKQKSMREESESDNEIRGVNFASATVVVFINKVLAVTVTKFTHMEKHHTKTATQISITFKLAIVGSHRYILGDVHQHCADSADNQQREGRPLRNGGTH